MSRKKDLLSGELKVINIGIETFAADLKKQGVDVVRVDWHPPAGGDLDILRMLEKLEGS